MEGTKFIEKFEAYCPQFLAEAGDPVGLHIGTVAKTVKRILITLDVRPDVVEEAIEKDIDLIIAKHPPLFRPAKRLTTDNPQTKMYLDLIQHNIAVYAAHTNLDIIENGLNDWFCEALGVENTHFLTQTHTFKDGISPLGTKVNPVYGIGRIGQLQKPIPLKDFAEKVAATFQVKGLRIISKDLDKKVSKVAICGGSGEKFYQDALKQNADVYITGDVYYHTAHDFLEEKTAVIDPGHYIEYYCKERLCAIFEEWKKSENWDVEFIVSKVNTNPFTVL